MNIYISLADHIDNIYPNPYCKPHDSDRAFVKIFKHLLTDEEVKIALLLNSHPVSAESLSQNQRLDLIPVKNFLHNLALKGIAYYCSKNQTYKLLPYCPGILEHMMSAYLDEEISGYLQEYVNEIKQFTNGTERVIQMDEPVSAKIYQASYNEVLSYMQEAQIFSLADCLCRTAKEKIGQSCGHTIHDICIQIGPLAEYYVNTGRAHYVTFDDAVTVLDRAKAEGLYLEISRGADDNASYFICCCCPCCCLSLRTTLSSYLRPRRKFRYTAVINQNGCNGCGECPGSCPASAIHLKNGKAVVDENQCIGCGMCTFFCSQNIITLTESNF